MAFVHQMITKNKKLLHLNLDGTNLSEEMLLLIAKAMRRAKALIGIHLSENPGTSEANSAVMMQLIHGRLCPQNSNAHYRLKASDRAEKEVSIIQRQLREEAAKEGERTIASDSVKLKQVQERKRIFQKKDIRPANRLESEKTCVIFRQLGHKADIPLSAQW